MGNDKARWFLIRARIWGLKLALAVITATAVAGCGSGGGNDGGPPTPPPEPPPQPQSLTISGTVQKGFFVSLDVLAFDVDEQTGALGEPTEATITDQNYSVEVGTGQLTLLEATGSFTSEFTGETVDLDEPLKLLVDTSTDDVNANINIATTISAELALQELPTSPLSADALIDEQDSMVNAVFGFPDQTDPSQLDFNNITENSDLADPNLGLLLFSGGIVEQLDSDQLYAGGFGDLLDQFLVSESLEQAQRALDVLGGLSASTIYDAAAQNSGFTLPPNPFGGIEAPILTCIANGTCEWQTAPLKSISLAGNAVWEASGEARFTIRLGEPAVEPVQIIVQTQSGTATVHEDFLDATADVTIPIGVSVRTVSLDLVIDSLVEGSESISLSISSSSTTYSVYRGESSLTIRDGAPATLDNQDAADVAVLTFSLDELCVPGLAVSGDGCSPFTGQEGGLGLIDGAVTLADTTIDLAADCSNIANCPPFGKDWRVDFFLVANDSVSSQGEVPLGPYIYNKNTLQLIGTQPLQRSPLVRLDDAAVENLAATAIANGWELELEARIGTTATNQVAEAVSIPSILAVPDTVLVGDTAIDILGVAEVVPGSEAGCAQGQWALTANYSAENSPVGLVAGTLCVDYDPSMPANPAVMVEGELDIWGGDAGPNALAILILPDGLNQVTTLSDTFGLVRPTISTTPFLALLPDAALTGQTAVFELHSPGWPMAFRIESLSLTPDGLAVNYDNIRYIHDVGYSVEDPRAQGGGLYSNDILYRGVVDRTGQSAASQGGTLILGSVGVDGNFAVFGGDAAASSTAFPRVRLKWQTFNQEIIDSELQPTTLVVDEATLRQRTSCAGPDCVAGQADRFSVTVASLLLDNDGFAIGDAVNSGQHNVPRWGARNDGSYAWTRPDDLTSQSALKFALPGYVIPNEGPVTGHLLAHLDEPEGSGDIRKYPAGTDAFIDGNYHPTGLSIGPEIYRDANGLPSTGDGQNLGMLGGNLLVDNGVDAAFSLAPSPGVKYVIRNAGITGVFNVESNSLGVNAPQFYGYQLDLERFAVRTVDNVLDTFNWIDGRLALNGDAGGSSGLDIFFTNLEVDCSAKLGNVDLLYERCDDQDNNGNGQIDENCDPVLYSWKAPMDIFGAGFDGGSAGQVCAVASQNFTLNHDLEFSALDKTVAFETQWDPSGSLVAQTPGEQPTYRFDRSDEGDGFPVRTSGASLEVAQVDNDGYGWLRFDNTQVGVPFWNALEADLRLANARRFNDIVAEPTVVVENGRLDQARGSTTPRNLAQRNRSLIQEAISAEETVSALYQWGNTGFGFKLPVYYQPWQLDSGDSDPDAQGRQSRFLGRELNYDLFVLEANAGINFIEPDRTKLSFGASADFTRLEGLTIQIDISDPDSAAAVDRTLEDLGIINGPLFEPALTDFLDAVDIVNRYASRGMDELMQNSLELALEEVGEATAPLTPNGQDPFVTASEALAEVQGLPQQGIALVRQEIRAPVERRIYSMEQGLRDQLALAQDRLQQLPANRTPEDVDAAFGDLFRFIENLESEVRAVDGAIDGVITEADSLRDEALSTLRTLREATFDVDLAISQTVTFADSVCTDGLVASSEGNGYLGDVAVRFTTIRRVADIIRNADELFGAAEAVTRNDDVKRRLATSRKRIRDATEELLGYVQAADQAVRDVICNTDDIALVTDRAFSITRKIRNLALDLEQAVFIGTLPLNDLDDLHDSLRTIVFEPLNGLKQSLTQIRKESDSLDNAALESLVACVLYDLTHPDAACVSFEPPATLEDGDLGINALVAENAGQRDLADFVFDSLRAEMDDIVGGAEDAFIAWTSETLPGAYMSPEQLRRLFVAEIMSSGPVRDLRLAMDEHFGEIGSSMNSIVLQFADQVNAAIESALASVTGPVNDALSEATAAVRAIPLQAAEINGYATIAGNELERAHLSAGWTMRGSDDSDSTGFKAALDAESWSARNAALDPELETATSCNVGENESLLDVKISAYGLPINVLAADIDIEKLYLGFTLKSGGNSGFALRPVGVFGGINTLGEIGFTDAIVFDPAFAAGLGEQQTYIGASAGAAFSGLEADVAFLVGKVCPGNTVLIDLDPEAANFIPLDDNAGFAGAYLRGGATIPIIPGGCSLNVGVSADFGTWILGGNPLQIGGLVGGGARGDVLCIASIKGKVRVGGTVSTNGDLKLRGEAWGVAGVGFDCDPGTWTSVRRSRSDSWCGTGDVQFDATFDNGSWIFTPPSPSAIY